MLSVFLAVIACPMPSLVLIEPSRFVFHHQLIIGPVTLAHQFAEPILNSFQARRIDRMMILSDRQRVSDIRRLYRQSGADHTLIAFQKAVGVVTNGFNVARDTTADHTRLSPTIA